MKGPRIVVIAVGFPILVMAAWVGNLVIERNSGTVVEFKVTGYDPRDVLSGRYLTYRVDYGTVRECPEMGGYAQCLCLDAHAGEGLARGVSASSCEANSCPLFLKGECRWGLFRAGIEEFFVSERFASDLAQVPGNATVRVSVTRSGRGYVQGLFVDGQPLAAWLAKNRKP